MQTLGPGERTYKRDEIFELFNESLDQLIKAAKDEQYDSERLVLINQARRNWHFVKGDHFLVPAEVETPFGNIDGYVPYAGTGDEDGAKQRPLFSVNLIGGDCMKYMAVMGGSAPKVKAVSDDPNDPENIEASKDADANVRDLWIKLRMDQRWKTMAFHQYTTGPSYTRTVWRTDRRKYGQTVEPNIELQEQIGPDGMPEPVPVEVGQQVYVNGDVECETYTVLEVAHPFMAKTLDECDWFRCQVMRGKWKLLGAYDRLEKYRTEDPPDESDAASNAATEARESVANPTGTGRASRQNHWRHTEYWFAPELFESVADKQARTVFQRQYPDGMYLALVGQVKVDIQNQNVINEWAVNKTGTGEKILEKPLCDNIVPLQRLTNDLFGLAAETILRGIAQSIVDSQLIDRQAFSKKDAVPAEMIFTMQPVDGDINKRIGQIPPARMSDQHVPFVQLVRGFWQDITGIRPELTGGGEPAPTFRQEKQRRDQALMQLAPQAHEMLYCAENIARNAVLLRSKYGSGTIKVARKSAFGQETDVSDLARLQGSGWHTEASTEFPVSATDRFDKLYEMLKEFPPEVQQALSILDPVNVEVFLELMQIPDFNSTIQQQKQKTLRDISLLLEGQPIEGSPGPMGEPGPKEPSVPPDEFDDHAFVSRFVPLWMISNTGQQARDAKPAGFENVLLFWQAHSSMIPPEPTVKTSVNMSVKPPEVGPEITTQILQGAGFKGLPPGQPLPMVPEPVPSGGAADGGSEKPPSDEFSLQVGDVGPLDVNTPSPTAVQ